MIPVQQKTYNDCFRACMASILELPNDDSLPHITSDKWHIEWKRLLGKFGLNVIFGKRDSWSEGYWIANVPSLNYPDKLHSIVMDGNNIAFDPSLKETYKKGQNLRGKNIIEDCCWLEVDDVSKLKNLDIFRDKLKPSQPKPVSGEEG
jgi:hypothetical protein